MVVAEVVKEFVLVTIMPVRQFSFSLRIPLVFVVVLIGSKGDLELFVLVSNVSHDWSQKGIESSSGVGKLIISTDPPNFARNASSQS